MYPGPPIVARLAPGSKHGTSRAGRGSGDVVKCSIALVGEPTNRTMPVPSTVSIDSMQTAPTYYSIRPDDPRARRWEVRCTVTESDPEGQRFALPAWIPGSYLIRDFARHIVAIRAESAGQPVALEKVDKHTWQARALPAGMPLTVIYEVYAGDLSVRATHVDQTHAFFNGSSVFLRPLGREARPCLVDIQRPVGDEYRRWRVATALASAHGIGGAAKRYGFGVYRAANYDELIDHPVEMGRFVLAAFPVFGVRHEVAISGRHDGDLTRLTNDLARLCEEHVRLFGPPAPVRRYVFLVTVVDEAYGGLEHRASTALLCARDALPYLGMQGTPERYRRFLGLCSHEYFHTWYVKRIKPAAFASYRLDRENYTTLLWAFEGFTAYYEDLTLLRCGLISLDEWLALIAETIDKVQRDPGQRRQTLAEASFDAWTKFYRPDESTPNSTVNYYTKGSLVALALDLTLRLGTGNRVSLDDVMRTLWRRHGVGPGARTRGVDDDEIPRMAEELSGLDLADFFADAVYGTQDLPLAHLLDAFGIRLECSAASPLPSLGIRTRHEGNEVRVTTVYDGGPAHVAGLAPGDLLMAIDGLRITPSSLERLLARRQAGALVEIMAFRRDELMSFPLHLAPPLADRHKLSLVSTENALRVGWLGV